MVIDWIEENWMERKLRNKFNLFEKNAWKENLHTPIKFSSTTKHSNAKSKFHSRLKNLVPDTLFPNSMEIKFEEEISIYLKNAWKAHSHQNFLDFQKQFK